MALKKHKFQSYTDEEDRLKLPGKVFTIRLNDAEWNELKADMKLLKQVKPGTTVKQLWKVGRDVLHDEKTGRIFRLVLGNLNRNERTGIINPDSEIKQM